MVVKVISTASAQVTCRKCKSVLEYVFQDTREVRHIDYGGCTEIYRGIDCPVCRSFVEVK